MKSLHFFSLVIIVLSISSCGKTDLEIAQEDYARAKERYAKSSAELDEINAQIQNTDNAINWLQKNQASRPKETEAAWNSCKYKAEGQDVSVALNCMQSTLDN